MARYESHHKAAERHLDAAVSQLIGAKESVEEARRRNDRAAEVHTAAIEHHADCLQSTKLRETEAQELLTLLASVADDKIA